MVHFDFRTRYQSVAEVVTDLEKINSGSLRVQPYKTASLAAKHSKYSNWIIRWSLRFGIGILILTAGLTVAFFAFAPREITAILIGGSRAIFFKDYQGAINDYNEAIRKNPNLAEAYMVRGLARFALADNSGSIEDFNKVLQLQPNNVVIYNTRGITRSINKDYPGAMGDKPPLALMQTSIKL